MSGLVPVVMQGVWTSSGGDEVSGLVSGVMRCPG